VALLGHKLTQEAFGNEEALGREVIVRGVRFRVVGVLMQKYFAGNDAVDAWAFQADPDQLEDAQKSASSR